MSNERIMKQLTLHGESSNPADHPICSLAADGNCPRGELCPHMHGDLCPTCGKHCLHPFRPQESEEHLTTCEKRHKHLEALKRSEEVECYVCLERVLSKPKAERKFGILSECDHPFCVSCIWRWRSSWVPNPGMADNPASKACPVCRKRSYFVFPSLIWHFTKKEKAEFVASYKEKLSSVHCKHFDFGNGNCQFLSGCIYRHTLKPGSYLWNETMFCSFSDSYLKGCDFESVLITDGEDDRELVDMFEQINYPPHSRFVFTSEPPEPEPEPEATAETTVEATEAEEEAAALFLLGLFDGSNDDEDDG